MIRKTEFRDLRDVIAWMDENAKRAREFAPAVHALKDRVKISMNARTWEAASRCLAREE